MFSYMRKPSLSSIASGETSFSSENSYLAAVPQASLVNFRELTANNLESIHSARSQQHQRYTWNNNDIFAIPRPILTIPRPMIHLPVNNSLWTPYARPNCINRSMSTSNPASTTATVHSLARPVYQNLPIAITSTPPPLPPLPPPVNQPYMIAPISQFALKKVKENKTRKSSTRIAPPGLFTTLCSGGLSTFVALFYLTFLIGLPTTKLVIGILYFHDCPMNQHIPIYMIVSGACGLGIVVSLLISTSCTFRRACVESGKRTHKIMLCTIALTRGLRGALTVFLLVWFFFGNIWIFGVRFRVQTEFQNHSNNYCHPTLYWFGFYVLIFTYVQALFTCCIKFCVNFFCCGACEMWQKAFS